MTRLIRCAKIRNMKKRGRERKEDVEFAGIEQRLGAHKKERQHAFARRIRRCAGRDCTNVKDLSMTDRHSNQVPDMICPSCRFKFFNVPPDLPAATKHDWRLFNAGYGDEKKDRPVRASQVNNRWYHAGRMTALELDEKKAELEEEMKKAESAAAELRKKLDEAQSDAEAWELVAEARAELKVEVPGFELDVIDTRKESDESGVLSDP